jgi:hypothetical protein
MAIETVTLTNEIRGFTRPLLYLLIAHSLEVLTIKYERSQNAFQQSCNIDSILISLQPSWIPTYLACH